MSSKKNKHEKRFEIGDRVTYLSISEIGSYEFGGYCHGGQVGTIEAYGDFIDSAGCWEIVVTAQSTTYYMLESEFKEYLDQSAKVGNEYPIY
jgi:hypothetical protein